MLIWKQTGEHCAVNTLMSSFLKRGHHSNLRMHLHRKSPKISSRPQLAPMEKIQWPELEDSFLSTWVGWFWMAWWLQINVLEKASHSLKTVHCWFNGIIITNQTESKCSWYYNAARHVDTNTSLNSFHYSTVTCFQFLLVL